MEEQKMSGEESLLLIQQMIQTAKQEQKDDGRGWIVWGWLLFLVSILTFFNLNYHWFPTGIFWNIFGITAMVFFLYKIIRYLFFKPKKKVRTYTRDLFDKLNIGFFIFLALIIASINLGVNPVKGFALLIALYGFWILIYGALLNFRPSILASLLTFGLALGGLFVNENDFQTIMILHGAAALIGYIIPGYIANYEFKKINKIPRV